MALLSPRWTVRLRARTRASLLFASGIGIAGTLTLSLVSFLEGKDDAAVGVEGGRRCAGRWWLRTVRAHSRFERAVAGFLGSARRTASAEPRDGGALQAGGSNRLGFKLGYVTDVEGNLRYFRDYVERSEVLDYRDGTPPLDHPNPGTLELREGTYFIFGGDLFDKGPGDIRLSKELVALKQRYPNRVYLLIGNRDANKLRFAAELSDAQLQQVPLDKMTAPFWLTKNRTPTEWLRRKKENKNKKKGEELFDAKEWRALDTRKTRLLWMLEDTLGCPNTFEFRREELALMKRKTAREEVGRGEAVEDGEVVSSFLEGLRPGGCYFEYLKHADIAVRLGNTLFVHGSVSPQSIDFVPSLRLPFAKNAALLPNTGHYVNQEGGGSNDSRSEPADRWIDALNRWGKQAFEEFAKSEAASLDAPLFSGESVESLGSSRPGQSLLCYQCAPGSVRRNVVVESYISRAIPREIPQSVAEYLLDSGISRVVAGHKPVGDCPMVMHTAVCSDGSPFPKYLETVFADTSYSDSKAEDSRGVAVSEVIVEGLSPDANRVRVHGLLRDGSTTIEYALRPLSRGGVDASPPLVPEHFVAEDDRLIGKRLADNFFVRARVSPGVARKAGVSEHAAQPKEHVPSTSSSCEKCHYFLEKTDVKTRRVTTRQASKTEVLCEINQQW